VFGVVIAVVSFYEWVWSHSRQALPPRRGAGRVSVRPKSRRGAEGEGDARAATCGTPYTVLSELS